MLCLAGSIQPRSVLPNADARPPMQGPPWLCPQPSLMSRIALPRTVQLDVASHCEARVLSFSSIVSVRKPPKRGPAGVTEEDGIPDPKIRRRGISSMKLQSTTVPLE